MEANSVTIVMEATHGKILSPAFIYLYCSLPWQPATTCNCVICKRRDCIPIQIGSKERKKKKKGGKKKSILGEFNLRSYCRSDARSNLVRSLVMWYLLKEKNGTLWLWLSKVWIPLLLSRLQIFSLTLVLVKWTSIWKYSLTCASKVNECIKTHNKKKERNSLWMKDLTPKFWDFHKSFLSYSTRALINVYFINKDATNKLIFHYFFPSASFHYQIAHLSIKMHMSTINKDHLSLP